MTWRIYVMPMTGTGRDILDPRVAKYWETLDLADGWAAMDYGFEPACIVAANLTPALATTLAAHADVLVLSANLDASLAAGDVMVVRPALEALNIPGSWVNTSLTWRELLRTVCAMFQFSQRLHTVLGNVRLFEPGVTLDTAFGALPPNVQEAIRATAQSLGWPMPPGLTARTSLRLVLKFMAYHWGSAEIVLGGVVI